ncbi:MAG: Xaa-Pro peptidase family protein, partial [Anaerolineae bacterium]|nr:Xaa-Pro peptidase family protein [Anaerolineae bacterium]
TFTQKMGDAGGDPVYPIIFGERDLGAGLLLLTRSGEHIAVVGGLDVAIPRATGVWDQVIDFKGSLGQTLIDLLTRLNPRTIAINYARNNPKADGLSYGKYLWLQDTLAGTPFLNRLVSAESLITKLRGRKSPGEIALMRKAIARTDEIFDVLKPFLQPGRTGREIYDFIHAETKRRGLETSWSRDHCPVVTVGPVAPIGHTPPGDTILQRGWTLQVDYGAKYNGICADFQRMWYVLEEGETEPPAEVLRLFETIRRGVDTIIERIQPGALTWEPAEAARRVLVEAGYPEFQFGVGHQLGRATHDGNPGLTRRVEGAPEWRMEAGNVFTAEGLETFLPGRGWISLEDDVLVTASGHEVLTTQQRALWLVR